MDISLRPKMSEAEMATLKAYILSLLKNPRLESTRSFPLSNRLCIYVNNQPLTLFSGNWMTDGGGRVLYMAGPANTNRAGEATMPERLGVIASIISLIGEWDYFAEEYSKVVTTTLLTSYNNLMGGIVTAQAPVTELAFNQTAGKIAGEVRGQWVAPNGEPVAVEGPEWTVVH